MANINGTTTQARKKSLASLVKARLEEKGETAELIMNRTNSLGHKDLVVVNSSIGLIHVIASSSKDPNASIPLGDYEHMNQDYLADKAYVAFGWNDKSNRTNIAFVSAESVKGNDSLSKQEINRLSVRELSGFSR